MPYEISRQGGGRITEPCTVCGAPANILQRLFGVGEVVDCSRCGDFFVSHVTADEIGGFPLRDPKLRALASHLIRKLQGGARPKLTTQFFLDLSRHALPTPAEASDNLLLLVAERTDGRPGKYIPIVHSDKCIQAIIGVVGDEDLEYIASALTGQILLESIASTGADRARLTPKGWLRFEELKRAHVASRYAFFARQFNNPDLDTVFEMCLRPAVAQTGYELRTVPQRAGLVDAIIEDEIRRCRFLVADLSDDNAGAYWEAGFAQGLGKDVIYVCKAKDGAEPKRTHFDANHRHTVRWDLSDPSSLDETARILKAVIRNTLLGDAKQED